MNTKEFQQLGHTMVKTSIILLQNLSQGYNIKGAQKLQESLLVKSHITQQHVNSFDELKCFKL